MELSDNIEARTMWFFRIQIAMTCNQRLRITIMQILQQHPQRTFLCLSACVLWSLAVGSQAADIAHADTMAVVVLAMSTSHLLRSPMFNSPVGRNDIMIPATNPTKRTMIPVNVRHSNGTARPIGGAVHDDQCDNTHTLTAVAKQLHQLRQS